MARSKVISSLKANVGIIVLNWNGWRDTVECLESVGKLDYPAFKVMIVDNDSSDQSVQRIKDWASGSIKKIETKFPQLVFPLMPKPLDLVTVEDLLKHPEQKLTEAQKQSGWFLIQMEDNVGFARGVNVAINFALQNLQCDYFYLLNNDTVLESTALSRLISAFEKNPKIAAAQSTIYYYDQPALIANAGGRIFTWGQTKYYKSIGKNEIKPVTFINGCALILPKKTIEKYGKLTEKFFFGEEDFEFSMRAKKMDFKMVAVDGSKVYHKIGISSQKHWEGYARRVLIFALSRLVDMRNYYPKVIWNLWQIFSVNYFWGLLIFKYHVPFKISLQIATKIFKYSKKLKYVRKQDIETILNEK